MCYCEGDFVYASHDCIPKFLFFRLFENNLCRLTHNWTCNLPLSLKCVKSVMFSGFVVIQCQSFRVTSDFFLYMLYEYKHPLVCVGCLTHVVCYRRSSGSVCSTGRRCGRTFCSSRRTTISNLPP